MGKSAPNKVRADHTEGSDPAGGLHLSQKSASENLAPLFWTSHPEVGMFRATLTGNARPAGVAPKDPEVLFWEAWDPPTIPPVTPR